MNRVELSQSNIVFDLNENEVLKFVMTEDVIEEIKDLQYRGEIEITNELLLGAIKNRLEEAHMEEVEEVCEMMKEMDLKKVFSNIVLTPYLEQYDVSLGDRYKSLHFGDKE